MSSLAAIKSPLRVLVWLLHHTAKLSRRQLSVTALFYVFASLLEIATLGAIVLAVRAIDPDQSVGAGFMDDRLGTGDGALVIVGLLLFAT